MRRAATALLVHVGIVAVFGNGVCRGRTAASLPPATPAIGASRVSDPMVLLEDAERFESAAVGFAGQRPRYAIAWREVLASRDAARHFRYLLDSAHTTAGRLYGLAGLRSAGAAAARDWLAAPPDWMADDVDVLFGCIGGRQPIADLLPAILDGSWIRDWSSAEISPPDT